MVLYQAITFLCSEDSPITITLPSAIILSNSTPSSSASLLFSLSLVSQLVLFILFFSGLSSLMAIALASRISWSQSTTELKSLLLSFSSSFFMNSVYILLSSRSLITITWPCTISVPKSGSSLESDSSCSCSRLGLDLLPCFFFSFSTYLVNFRCTSSSLITITVPSAMSCSQLGSSSSSLSSSPFLQRSRITMIFSATCRAFSSFLSKVLFLSFLKLLISSFFFYSSLITRIVPLACSWSCLILLISCSFFNFVTYFFLSSSSLMMMMLPSAISCSQFNSSEWSDFFSLPFSICSTYFFLRGSSLMMMMLPSAISWSQSGLELRSSSSPCLLFLRCTSSLMMMMLPCTKSSQLGSELLSDLVSSILFCFFSFLSCFFNLRMNSLFFTSSLITMIVPCAISWSQSRSQLSSSSSFFYGTLITVNRYLCFGFIFSTLFFYKLEADGSSSLAPTLLLQQHFHAIKTSTSTSRARHPTMMPIKAPWLKPDFLFSSSAGGQLNSQRDTSPVCMPTNRQSMPSEKSNTKIVATSYHMLSSVRLEDPMEKQYNLSPRATIILPLMPRLMQLGDPKEAVLKVKAREQVLLPSHTNLLMVLSAQVVQKTSQQGENNTHLRTFEFAVQVYISVSPASSCTAVTGDEPSALIIANLLISGDSEQTQISSPAAMLVTGTPRTQAQVVKSQT